VQSLGARRAPHLDHADAIAPFLPRDVPAGSAMIPGKFTPIGQTRRGQERAS
jgi:hypothetical protein